MKKPLLSIIIATRNRQQYCLESIESILIELTENCELVIQDNSSDNSLESSIQKINDSRIRYNYNPRVLSFIDNFEEALTISIGKYFCILGDDDSILGNIIDVVNWMENENIDTVSSKRVVDYFWPNNEINEYKNGLLLVPTYSYDKVEINAKLKLKELVGNGFLNYQSFDLPRTYHGVVKREVMDEVKNKSGRYFGGLTPDIFSTIALSCVVKKHFVIDFPFSIAGACPASASAKSKIGGHSGKLKEAPHFKGHNKYVWEEMIPEYYSVETIWAESGIKALKALGECELLPYFNKYKLYCYGILINRRYIFKHSFCETLRIYKKINTNFVSHFFKIINNMIGIFFNVFFKRLRSNNLKNNYHEYAKVASFDEVKLKINMTTRDFL